MNDIIMLQEGMYSSEECTAFLATHAEARRHDIFAAQVTELAEIGHPAGGDVTSWTASYQAAHTGTWAYFPWKHTVVHMLRKEDHEALLTNRNQQLVTDAEQTTLRTFNAAIAGLSVGQGVAQGLVHMGIGAQLNIADFDTLETANLNRMRGGVCDIGLTKIEVLRRYLLELNPYTDLGIFDEGITTKTRDQFLDGMHVLVEMIDSFEEKVRLRMLARERGIPVVMTANIGDRLIVDIERYDLDRSLPLFNGLLGDVPEEILTNPDTSDELKHSYAVKLVGKEYIPQRALESVMEIGKTLVGRPQLFSTVTISSGLLVYLIRQIALGGDVPSGRYYIPFDKSFITDAHV